MWHPKTRTVSASTTEWERCGHVDSNESSWHHFFPPREPHPVKESSHVKQLFKLFVCMCSPTARSWSLIEKTCFQALKETSIMRSQADTVT